MTSNWYKAYFAALAGICADHQVDDAVSAVQWAVKVADISEKHLAEHEAAQAAAPTLREPLTAKMKEEAIHRVRLAVPRNYDRSPSDLITDLSDAIGAELDLARLLP